MVKGLSFQKQMTIKKKMNMMR